MTHLERFYPESRFGGFSNVDGSIHFYTRINALLEPGCFVLDFGCGVGNAADPLPIRRRLRDLRLSGATVLGIDVDPTAQANPFLSDFRLVKPGAPLPVHSQSVDLVLCDCVLEHLPDPAFFFSEAARVLRPHGCVCIRTPNAFSYLALAARMIPERFHIRILRALQPARSAGGIFTAYYRCNTVPALRRALSQAGFEHVVYTHESEPSYLGFCRFSYLLGVIHQAFAPPWLRTSVIAFGRLCRPLAKPL